MSQRYYKKEAKIAQPAKKREAKSAQKLNSKAEYSKKIEQPSPEKSQLGSATKKRRWIQEFTVKHGPTNLKRRRIFVDLIELQHYSGMALCSNHVIGFKIVKNELDMLSDKEPFFHPKFSHQIFHKDETVRGFKNLTIDIFLTPATLRPFLNVNFEKQAKNHDEIESTLSKHFGEDGLLKTRKQFLDAVKDEETKFKPLGKKVGSFIRQMPIQDNDLLNLLRNYNNFNAVFQIQNQLNKTDKISENLYLQIKHLDFLESFWIQRQKPHKKFLNLLEQRDKIVLQKICQDKFILCIKKQKFHSLDILITSYYV